MSYMDMDMGMGVSYTGITRYMTLHTCRHVEPRTPNTERAVH